MSETALLILYLYFVRYDGGRFSLKGCRTKTSRRLRRAFTLWGVECDSYQLV